MSVLAFLAAHYLLLTSKRKGCYVGVETAICHGRPWGDPAVTPAVRGKVSKEIGKC